LLIKLKDVNASLHLVKQQIQNAALQDQVDNLLRAESETDAENFDVGPEARSLADSTAKLMDEMLGESGTISKLKTRLAKLKNVGREAKIIKFCLLIGHESMAVNEADLKSETHPIIKVCAVFLMQTDFFWSNGSWKLKKTDETLIGGTG